MKIQVDWLKRKLNFPFHSENNKVCWLIIKLIVLQSCYPSDKTCNEDATILNLQFKFLSVRPPLIMWIKFHLRLVHYYVNYEFDLRVFLSSIIILIRNVNLLKYVDIFVIISYIKINYQIFSQPILVYDCACVSRGLDSILFVDFINLLFI